MRVALDTNVLFAAFAFEHGFCATLLRACVIRHQLISSQYILSELRHHLSGKGNLSAEKIDEVVMRLREIAQMVVPVEVPPNACRDPDDLAVLGTAVAAHADALVTGDKDLLVVGRHERIPIVSPRDFHDRFLG